MCSQTNIKCKNCGDDNWFVIDDKEELSMSCLTCANNNISSDIVIKKQKFVDEFVCEKCGCPRGTLRENDKEMVMICDNCFEKKVVFEKPLVDIDNRDIPDPPAKIEEKVSCPKCGSTQIATGARGINLTFGLFGASKTVNRCQKCGYTWKPHR